MLAGDRVSGTDADRHEDISHNGSSGFGGNTDSAETADLGRVLIDAQDHSAAWWTARLVATAAERRGRVRWLKKASAGRFTQPDL